MARKHDLERWWVFATALTTLTACVAEGRSASNDFPQLVRYSSGDVRPLPNSIANAEPDDGQWLRPAKDYSSSRFSALNQINASNVGELQEVWHFNTGIKKGHEAAPLFVNGVLYIVTPYPNTVYAFDIKLGGTPVWTFKAPPVPMSQGVACCDVVNRGMSYANGRLVFNTLDGRTYALDARTGKELWHTQLADISKGESITMAPLIVKDHVLVGNSGGEFGVRGWLTALDLNSGAIAWQAFHTGPDSDVKIGPRFNPYYAADRAKDLGVESWPGESWRIGGGGMWGWISYDPKLNRVYYGSANPGPWNAEQRPGDNKWTSTLFARDPDTGDAIFAYQFSPHDLYDYDAVNEQILLDLPLTAGDSARRKVLLRPERNGYMYVIDRVTGQVLFADPYGDITTTKGVDLRTGRLRYDSSKATRPGMVVRGICPAAPGMKDWQPSSYSPQTGMLYVPHQTLCEDEEGVEANYIMGTPFVGATLKMYATPSTGGSRGELLAWDVVGRKRMWAVREDFPVWSGALATAGDLVFYGTMDGWFKAVDARNGTTLWKFKTESGIISQPMTFRAADGKQYVAVLSGVGGWAGGIVPGALDARDSSAAGGFVNAVKDLPAKTKAGGMLHVFALP